MSRSRKDRRPKDASDTSTLIARRGVLGIIGVGGLLLTLPRVARAANGTAIPASSPTPNCPTQCPTKKPTLPKAIDISELPGLAQLIGTLAQDGDDGRTNRRQFNTCPETFFNWYSLSDADVASLINFQADDVTGPFSYLATKVGADDLPALFQLYCATDKFYKDWPGYSVKDCYDDPPGWCKDEWYETYAHPNTRIMHVDQSRSGDVVTLTVTAEGLVRSPTMKVFLETNGSEVTVTEPKVVPNSTFRCGRMTGKAELEKGERYRLELTMAGSVTRPSQPFVAK